MDRTERPKNKRRVSKCHVTMRGNALSGSAMLHFPVPLLPHSCLAEEESYEKKLVAQQEVIPKESRAVPGTRGLPSDLSSIKKVCPLYSFSNFKTLVWLVISENTFLMASLFAFSRKFSTPFLDEFG